MENVKDTIVIVGTTVLAIITGALFLKQIVLNL